MPQFLIDVTRLLHCRVTRRLPTGIDRFGLAYVRRYGGASRAVLSLGPFSATLSARDSAAVFDAVSAAGTPVRALALRVVLKAFLWRWLADGGRDAILLNTGHYGLESPRYGASLRWRGTRAVVVVHDLIPLEHPEFCRPDECATHGVRMRSAATVASALVFNSQVTREAFEAYCRAEAMPVPPAIVAHPGAGLGTPPAIAGAARRAVLRGARNARCRARTTASCSASGRASSPATARRGHRGSW